VESFARQVSASREKRAFDSKSGCQNWVRGQKSDTKSNAGKTASDGDELRLRVRERKIKIDNGKIDVAMLVKLPVMSCPVCRLRRCF